MESASCLPSTHDDFILLHNASITVLGSLMVENDEVVETFFLLGCAFAALKDKENTAMYMNRAKEMLEKCKVAIEEEMSGRGFDAGGELQLELEDIEMRLDTIEEKMEDFLEDDNDDETMDDD